MVENWVGVTVVEEGGGMDMLFDQFFVDKQMVLKKGVEGG